MTRPRVSDLHAACAVFILGFLWMCRRPADSPLRSLPGVESTLRSWGGGDGLDDPVSSQGPGCEPCSSHMLPDSRGRLWSLHCPWATEKKEEELIQRVPQLSLGGSLLLSALSSFPPMTWYVPFQECRKPDPRFSIQLKPLVPPSQGQENEKSLREHPWGILLASSVFSAASLFFLSLHCPPALPHPFRHGTPGERA